jgi:hypothetical protein
MTKSFRYSEGLPKRPKFCPSEPTAYNERGNDEMEDRSSRRVRTLVTPFGPVEA